MPENGWRFSQKLQPVSMASRALDPAASRCHAARVAFANPFCAQVLITVTPEAGIAAAQRPSEATEHVSSTR